MPAVSPKKTTKSQTLIIGTVIIGIIGLIILYFAGVNIETLKELFSKTLGFLRNNPSLIFFGIAILPGLAFPVSALLIAAGGVYGEKYGTPLAALICIVAIAINILWTYLLARGPARNILNRIIANAGHTLPEVNERNHLRVTLILRITPGIPLFIQNYLLGLANIPFKTYISVSIGIQALWTIGFVVFGEALLEGNLVLLIGAAGMLVAVGLGTKIIKTRMDSKKNPTDDAQT
ncbi:VTT domain-containing protein [Verrucomicrobia bacterium]|nr:VTT domain-containing protein [Verrucomicrobiota bacterium]MDB4458953.1 VTT domain-containing protein [bacterium]